MKSFIIIFFSVLFCLQIKAQELSEEDIPKLVEIIDEQVQLNQYQKAELNKIFIASLEEHQRIQRLNIVDIEKLELIQKNQATTRNKLEVVLQPDQYQSYVAFLDGANQNNVYNNNQPLLNNSGENSPKPKWENFNNDQPISSGATNTVQIAEQLGLTSTKKTEFVMIYDAQEAAIQNVISSGTLDEAKTMDLLTTILTTDFKIIDLAGKPTYEKYFQMRQNGQLNNNGAASNQNVDIAQVYTFYDLKEGLEMNDNQTEAFIRLFLSSELEKRNIRASGQQVDQKLKQLELETFGKLKQFLSDSQFNKLVQMIGG